jgi:hypothetical protein
MVWGMSIPSTFGEFWPDGDFEYDRKMRESGWRGRLIAHYLAEPRQEQKRLFNHGDDIDASGYAGYAIGKFTDEVGTVHPFFPDRPPFSVIEPHEPPKTFDTEKTYKSLGSLIALNSGLLAVDEAVKAIIEQLEPKVHQFFPIDIIMPKSVAFPKDYYVLVIGRYFDSFSPENSKEDSYSIGSGYYGYSENKNSMSGLAFSTAVFGGAHLWRERRFFKKLTCFSDELQSGIIKAGLRLPKHYEMKEV